MSVQVNKKSIFNKIIIGIVVALFILTSLLLVACKKQEELHGTLLADAQTFANGNLDYSDNTNSQLVLPTPSNWSYQTGSSANGSAPSSVASSGNIIVNNNVDPKFTTKADWDNFKRDVDSIRTREARQKYFIENFDWTSGYIWAYLDYLQFKDTDSSKRPFYFTDITKWQSIPGMLDYVKKELVANNKDFDKADLEKHSYWDADNYKRVGEFITWVKQNSILKNLISNTLTADRFQNNQHSILMLSNYVDDSDYGTASQYTSTSITLPAGTMARLSVDVFTALSDYKGDGANITITPTIASNAQKSIILNNIDTTDSTNGTTSWKTYTLFLQASQYAETSFTLSLGLGRQTANSALNRAEGYAFFDNVTYQVDLAKKMKEDFSSEINVSSTKPLVTTEDTIIDATANTSIVYNCDLVSDTATLNTSATPEQTKGNKNNSKSTFSDYFGITGKPTLTSVTDTITPMSTNATAISLDNTHNVTTAINGFTGNTGIPTTLNNFINLSGNSPTTDGKFTLQANQKALVGMWVKSTVSTTINLVEENGTGSTNPNFPKSVASVTLQTDKIDEVSIIDDKNGRRNNIYGINYSTTTTTSSDEKWQYVQFFVTNSNKDSEAKFSIELQVGLTEFTQNTYLGDFSRGTAVIASPNVKLNISDAEYNMHTTGDYCQEAELQGTATSSGGFGRAISRMAVSTAEASTETTNTPIVTQIAQNNTNNNSSFTTNALATARATGVNPFIPNYTGTAGNTGLVGGTATNTTAPNANTGLIDKNSTLDNAPQSLSNLISNWTSSNSPLLSSKSPLLIYGQNYGYFANTSTTLSTSAYFSVNVKLLLAQGATAYIYLIDMTNTEQENYAKNPLQTTLGYNYKYDNNGNVVTSYDNNTAHIVFYMQANGLWKTGSNNGMYYANLLNYQQQTDKKHAEYKPENLVDASGNIIYYYQGERAGMPQYTRTNSNKDRDYVQDFTAAVKDGSISQDDLNRTILRTKPNEQNNDQNQLVATVTGTAQTEKSWTDVNFFIATGSTERKYRLEVFLGARNDSTTVDSQHWVIYETVKYDTLTEENYNKLLKEYQDKYIESETDTTKKVELIKNINNREDHFTLTDTNNNKINYWHYSLYDSGYYAPYNAKNTNLTGNPYSSYDPTQYSKQIAYLQFKDSTSITTIANFKTFENNVASSDITEKPTTSSSKFTGNIPLLITSLVLIVAILVAVVVLLWRKFFKNIKFNFKKRTPKAPKHKQAVATGTENTTKTDVLPNKDEIDSEELYNFNIEENNPTIDENE